MSIVEEIKSGQKSVGNLVKDKTATFQYYRQGNLIYMTEDGFEFPVPISDCGESTFFDCHTALELMRWIRKQVDVVKGN